MKKEIIRLQEYAIYLGDYWPELTLVLTQKKYSQIFVLVDENTRQHCLPILEEQTGFHFDHVIEIRSGESFKNLHTCQDIWNILFKKEADRKSLLVNLGGGVIGDMGGFCAGTYMRGISFIQIPTTLLAQVDASVGGKTGIDYYGLKNAIGQFVNPLAVFVNPIFLKTLPADHIRSGYAEMIKHGLIRNAQLFSQVYKIKTLDDISWVGLIGPSIHIKKQVVSEDPLEAGLRKILNFGHTIGHGIESVRLDESQPILHGDAIAFGMIAEGFLSHKYGTLPQEDLEQLSQYIISIFGKIKFDISDFDRVINKMRSDKKNERHQINFSLLKKIGEAEANYACHEEQIVESFKYYIDLSLQQ